LTIVDWAAKKEHSITSFTELPWTIDFSLAQNDAMKKA